MWVDATNSYITLNIMRDFIPLNDSITILHN